MSNLYREPSIDASYQIPIHLASSFREDFLEIDIFQNLIFVCVYSENSSIKISHFIPIC
jgi:hypothetical protein